MQKRLLILPALTLALSAVLGYGCHSQNNANSLTPPSAPPVQTTTAPPAVPPQSQTAQAPSQDASATITADVNKLLAQTKTPSGLNSPFPPGTQLKSVSIEGDVATLDFSKEFNGLIDSGETTESMAQRELRKAASHVFGVEKMRVTVEGKPFESEATDWNTPFPVRFDTNTPLLRPEDTITVPIDKNKYHGERP
jgi:hypothetical protein